MANQNQTFARIPAPAGFEKLQPVITDIYDKAVAALTKANAASSSATTTTTNVTQNIIATSIEGAGGQAAGPQFAFIPSLTVLPSNNPTTGAPYAVDGLLIQVNDQFWRYAGNPTYEWQLAGSATAILTDTHANRVVNYPAATYPNALFLESDTLLLLESNAVIWRTIAGDINDTHANRLSTWPSVQFSVGTSFFETDRTAYYVVENATGNVTVTGTSVAWTSGNHFINTGTGFTSTQWPAGTVILLNGATCHIASIASDIALTLQAPVANGVYSYVVQSGRWVYQSGQYSSALANLPGDLGENDTTLVSSNVTSAFLFFENAAYAHQLQWNVSAWQRGPADRDHSDTFAWCGATPTDIGWHACDGSTQNYLKYDGTTGSRVLPALSTAAYPKATEATYAPTLVPPGTGSTAGGSTDPTMIGFNPAAGAGSATAGTGSVNAGTGAAVPVLTPPFTGGGGGGGGSLVTDPHSHTLSGGSVTFTSDPVENFSLILCYRQ